MVTLCSSADTTTPATNEEGDVSSLLLMVQTIVPGASAQVKAGESSGRRKLKSESDELKS